MPGETEPPGNAADASPPPGSEVAAFAAADDIQLYGHAFRPGRKVVVVLLHASNADERAWFPFAQRLVSAGYSAVTFDFRGYRASEATKDPAKAPLDVEGAIEYARLQGAERIALVGTELGGTAAVASADGPSVRAIAAINAGPSFGSLDASSVASRVRVAALVIAAGSREPERLAKIIQDAKLETFSALDDAAIQHALLSFLQKALPI